MSVKKIIQESIEKNPLGIKEALQEELAERVRLALEAKMKEQDEMEDEDEDDEDEDDDLYEAAHRVGDRVTWRDHSSGKNMTGTVHNAHGGRMKGGSLAVVKVDGTHMGSTAKIPHKQLSKIDEDFEQLDEISKKTLASYVKKAGRSADRLSKSAAKYSDKASMAHFDSMAGSGGRKALDRATKYDNRAAADSKKAANRSQGIARATDRLAK